MKLKIATAVALVFALQARTVLAQVVPAADKGLPALTPELVQQIQSQEAAARAMPDTEGSGPYPSIKEEVASLPAHVIYRPRDLTKVKGKLPIIAWGNGGCSGDGAGQRIHLTELASHGYLVIASGTVRSGPGAPPQRRQPVVVGLSGFPAPETSPAQLTQAIDWAIAQNHKAGSPLRGRIDTQAIAVSGWSCGGLQALSIAAADPRIRAIVIHNSGVLPPGGPAMPGMDITKDALARLRAPVIYILGGPSDIAYRNGVDDFERIKHVPAILASLSVGHIGTFFQPNGGAAAKVAVAFLDWRLKGSQTGREAFTGPQCDLCRQPEWTLQSNSK